LFTLKLICNNKVCSFFKKSGYEIHNYSIFDINGQFAQERNSFVPARTKLFTSQTLLNRLKDDVWVTLAKKFKRKEVVKKSILGNLNYNQRIYDRTIKTIHSLNRAPKFVYTHLELPHFPYYYDQNGNLYPYEIIVNIAAGDKKKYIQYLQYTNKVLTKLIDEIIYNNSTPPVVILMSDHGYRWASSGTDSYVFNNLFSVYLPGKNYSLFNDSITNVNVFRTLLNTEFCQQMPMLKDTTITIGY
jgi:hypothetical protein